VIRLNPFLQCTKKVGKLRQTGLLGAACHSRDGFRSDKHPTMMVEWSFCIEGLACQVFDQLAIGFEHLVIGTVQVYALGVISPPGGPCLTVQEAL
jgi:hypothetical protein